MVIFIYLVPSDKKFRQDFKDAIENAALNIQNWYFKQLDKTFALNEPIVDVFNTKHPSFWYSTNDTGFKKHLWFWTNTINDGYEVSKIDPKDKSKVAIFYIDADHATDQYGGAGELGRAVLPRVDLLGLIGRNATNPCRWVGGLGHELGHALGLSHPSKCEIPFSTNCENEFRSLMYMGYYLYPNTHLLDEDKAILNKSELINQIGLNNRLCNCKKLIKLDNFSDKLLYYLIRFYKSSPFNSSRV